jgi:pyridoxamine 5'-phosphate oxidase
MDKISLQQLRLEYSGAVLDEETVLKDPLLQFEKWFADAMQAELPEPNAMAVATSGIDFKPSSRIVLLKGLDHGFVFYTNYNSRKGKELLWNPYAALLFFWNELHRQVRIEGRVEKAAAAESDEYFDSRPPGSKLGAIVSPQSEVIPGRKFLEMKLEEKSAEASLQRPAHWGGYRVIPYTVEFWQGRPNRLHDRLLFTLVEKDKWKLERLAP